MRNALIVVIVAFTGIIFFGYPQYSEYTEKEKVRKRAISSYHTACNQLHYGELDSALVNAQDAVLEDADNDSAFLLIGAILLRKREILNGIGYVNKTVNASLDRKSLVYINYLDWARLKGVKLSCTDLTEIANELVRLHTKEEEYAGLALRNYTANNLEKIGADCHNAMMYTARRLGYNH